MNTLKLSIVTRFFVPVVLVVISSSCSSSDRGIFGEALLTAGAGHTCLVDAEGRPDCWGHNGFGQLGSQELGDWMRYQVDSLPERVVAISAGAYHTCALTSSGEIYCWGRNTYGQLGDGTSMDHVEPVLVKNLPGPMDSISAGADHTCSLDTKGKAYCWGRNTYGQIGDGTTLDRPFAFEISQLPETIESISAGGVHTCALTASGRVYCWGDGGNERIPIEDGSPVLTPVELTVLSNDNRAIDNGEFHTCVLKQEGTIICWGAIMAEPQSVANPLSLSFVEGDPQTLSGGAGFSCTLTDAGVVYCWGDNYFGQLGDPLLSASNQPVKITVLLDQATKLAAGSGHACVMNGNSSVQCWGDNSFGQLDFEGRR